MTVTWAGGAVEVGLLVAASALALVSLLLVLAAILAQRRLRRTLKVTRGGSGNAVLTALQRHEADLDLLDAAVSDLQARVAAAERDLDLCTNRVAMVHYDAFPDMGGKLSFSLAMLDDQGDGIVLSVINGRTETRAWGKRVVAGAGRQRLSDEESLVIERAMSRDRRGDATTGDAR